MPTYPLIYLQLSTDQWGTDGYTWVYPLNERARSITVRRGRSSELDEYNAGTLTAVIENGNRAFDPDADPSLATGGPIRLVADGVPIFTGYVDSFDPSEDAEDVDQWVTVNATDGFKILARSSLRSYPSRVLIHDPIVYWRLGEPSGTTALDSSTHGNDGTYTGSPVATDSLVAESDDARLFDGVDDWVDAPNPMASLAPFTLEGWIGGDGSASTPPLFISWGTQFASVRWNVATSNWEARLQATSSSGISISTGLLDPSPSAPRHHVVLQWTGTSLDLYIDSSFLASSGTVTGGGASTTAANRLRVGWGSAIGYGAGTVDEFALYDYVIPDTVIVDHYLAALTYNTEETGDRITRALMFSGWPASLRTVSTVSTITVGPPTGTTALDMMREATAVELGALYMAADGKVIFKDRAAARTGSPVLTLSDDDPTLRYSAMPRRFDESFLANEIVVNWSDTFAPAIAVDAASIAQHGRVTQTVDQPMGTFADALALAQARLALYANPSVRVDEMTITLGAGRYQIGDNFADMIALDLGDVITVERTPGDVPSQIVTDFQIQAIGHTITPDRWEMTLTLSPIV